VSPVVYAAVIVYVPATGKALDAHAAVVTPAVVDTPTDVHRGPVFDAMAPIPAYVNVTEPVGFVAPG
jgi:hypothetical protein